jgi:uncharacterized protein (TIGR04255 family)
MPFPVAQRVHYRRNPLQQVICQLRFPAVLRIDAEVPAAFQERIRDSFPIYKAVRQPSIEIGLPEPLSKILGEHLSALTVPVTHQFKSADDRWLLSLCNSFLALTDTKYTRWEEFREKLDLPLQSLESEYRPAFFDRLGLRYQNLIRRSDYGLENVSWSELLKPHISAELSSSDIASEIEQAARQVVIAVENGKVQVQHGLIAPRRNDGLVEQCFGIDADFYRDQRTEVANGRAILDGFSRIAGWLFQWCITKRLHEAMEPEPI